MPLYPLRDSAVEEELSVAYLHAVTAAARMSISPVSRHLDERGTDTIVTAWFNPIPIGGYLSEVPFSVQLKATKQQRTPTATHIPFVLEKPHYDLLRMTSSGNPRILVVLFLPPKFEDWLLHSSDQLLMRQCAYWVSLREAEDSTNQTSQTIYVPKSQSLNPENLIELATQFSRLERPVYQKP